MELLWRVQLYCFYTAQLDWKVSFSPWVGLVSRRTQRRTDNLSGVAESLRTSEAPIHLEKYPQIFPSLAALGGPPQPGQSCQPEGLDKTVSINRKWLLISKHGKENSISCFVQMPLLETKQRRLVKQVFKSSSQFNLWAGLKNSWSVHI